MLGYDGGIAFVAENPSRALHKISEIYDRIAFAAVGKYNEFENLRVAGVRYADLRGYSYDRIDVTARGLANAYAQTLGAVFTTESKPLEVEIVVAEVGGDARDDDQIYRLTYDGSVAEEQGFVAMGGQAEQITDRAAGALAPGHDPRRGAHARGRACSRATRRRQPPRARAPASSRWRSWTGCGRGGRSAGSPGRCSERLLSADDPTTDVPHTDDPRPGLHDTLTGGDRPPRRTATPRRRAGTATRPASRPTASRSRRADHGPSRDAGPLDRGPASVPGVEDAGT